jgi:hypothetical protein
MKSLQGVSIDNTDQTLDSYAEGRFDRVEQFYQDTNPEILKIIIEGYRAMSPQQKLIRVNELTRSIQQLALARIRKQFGDIPEHEQKLRLASLWLDRETMIRVFDWDPEIKGY